MRKATVSRVILLCLLSVPLGALALHSYAVRELLAVLLYFSLLFWAIAILFFILMVLFAASWNLVAWLATLAAHLGSHSRHPAVRPTTAGGMQDW